MLFEQTGLHDVAGVRIAPKMAISQLGHHASARGTFDESLHDEERFIDFLDRAGILADGGEHVNVSLKKMLTTSYLCFCFQCHDVNIIDAHKSPNYYNAWRKKKKNFGY